VNEFDFYQSMGMPSGQPGRFCLTDVRLNLNDKKHLQGRHNQMSHGRGGGGSGGGFVDREMAEKWSSGSAVPGPVYRGTGHPEEMPSKSGGAAYSALGEGYYFLEGSEGKRQASGYGDHVVEYRVNVNKVKTVRGDAEMDQVRHKAKEWADGIVNPHLAEVAAGKSTPDPEKLALISSHTQTSAYLKSQGYGALRYEQVDPLNDHHNQLLVFDVNDVVGVKGSHIE